MLTFDTLSDAFEVETPATLAPDDCARALDMTARDMWADDRYYEHAWMADQ